VLLLILHYYNNYYYYHYYYQYYYYYHHHTTTYCFNPDPQQYDAVPLSIYSTNSISRSRWLKRHFELCGRRSEIRLQLCADYRLTLLQPTRATLTAAPHRLARKTALRNLRAFGLAGRH